MSDPHIEGEQSRLNRRSLIKKMAVGAFAVPTIVSFQMDSLARAGSTSKKHQDPGQSYPNQCHPNQQPDPHDHDHDPHGHDHDPPPKPPKPPKPKHH